MSGAGSERELLLDAESRGDCHICLYRVPSSEMERAFEFDVPRLPELEGSFQGVREHITLLGVVATLFVNLAERARLPHLADRWQKELQSVEPAAMAMSLLARALGTGAEQEYILGIKTAGTQFALVSRPEHDPGLRTYRFAIPYDDGCVAALDGGQRDHALLAVLAAIDIVLAEKLELHSLKTAWLALRDGHSRYMTEQLVLELHKVAQTRAAGAPS